ncbi:MAG TPA: replication-relaxation family protein [Mycobacteriales bacterium]|jgi:hypothetical protein
MTRAAVVTLTSRDHDLVRAAWSLGWVTSPVLAQAVSPGTLPKTLAVRLSRLAAAGYLRRRRIVGGPQGHVWLYGAGPHARRIDAAYADAWRPSDAQLLHTLAIGDTLAALLTPGRLGTLRAAAWRGEAELRAWHAPGDAVADLHLAWTGPDQSGAWHVEVDRATESRNAWRRKLVRYLHAPGRDLLVVTTSTERARNIAILARELGVPALTTDRHTLHADAVLQVYDAVKGRRRSVDDVAN